jgi:glycosyltransferase involved in cell wall biosynthesis
MTHGFNGHFVARLLRRSGCHKGGLVSSYHGLYHATSAGRKVLAPVFNRFTEWHIRRTQATVVVAEDSRRYLTGKGIPGKLLEVIHNGIEDCQCNEDARQKLRAEWMVDDHRPVVGVASRLDPVKGIEYLLTAFSRLSRKHGNAVLVVVGTGAVEKQLQAQAAGEGVGERVRFTGFRSDVAQCLCAFDIFVLPSLAEYHSIGLLEAMRAGRPIVATDVGGNTESVRDGREALIVKPADAEALESALDRLLSRDDLREQLGNAARSRFVAEFTEDVMLEKTGAWLRRNTRSHRHPV